MIRATLRWLLPSLLVATAHNCFADDPHDFENVQYRAWISGRWVGNPTADATALRVYDVDQSPTGITFDGSFKYRRNNVSHPASGAWNLYDVPLTDHKGRLRFDVPQDGEQPRIMGYFFARPNPTPGMGAPSREFRVVVFIFPESGDPGSDCDPDDDVLEEGVSGP